ncbi:MAG: DUF1289 domain-containing protein [Tepidimonas sp.]|nr:DUF1289 domain-containing protein [Tepidimonas sp.]
MEATSGLCAGCWRTLHEIAAWATADQQTRLRIRAEADQRRQGLIGTVSTTI